MKSLNINQTKLKSWITFSIIFLILLSCSDETDIQEDRINKMKEEYRAIKQSTLPEVSTTDLSIFRKSAKDGHAMGKVVIKFPEWGITEIYSFKAKTGHGEVTGYFEVEDFVDETGEGFDHCWGKITCITFEDDGKTARLSGEVTGSVNHPDGVMPEHHYARFTVVDNHKSPDQATALFVGQPLEDCEYHCNVGIPVEDMAWWGTFREIEGMIKVKPKNCLKKRNNKFTYRSKDD